MIRGNLATRPFYNEGAVRVWLTALAAVLAVATALNIVRVAQYSGSNTELEQRASRNERRAGELRTAAAQLRGSVDVRQIEAASVEARQANALIDRRTFSWTELFNRFATTLPPDVRITAVRPLVDKERRVVLTVTVLARGVDDVSQFMESLEATGAFTNLLSRQERINEDDQIESVLETVYAPPRPEPTARPASAAISPAASREGAR